MLNITEESKRIEFLKGKTAQAAGDYSARLGRYTIAQEEYQQAIAAYNLVDKTFPDFVEAQNHKKAVQKILAQLPSEDKHKQSYLMFDPLFILGQWLQNKFDNAKKAGWLPLEEIVGKKVLKRHNMTDKAIKRAKQVDLGNHQIIALVIELNETKNQSVKIIIRVLPIGEQIYLPDNLQLTVIPKSGKSDEYLTEHHNPGFETECCFYKHGEQFTVKMQLNDVIVTESFVL